MARPAAHDHAGQQRAARRAAVAARTWPATICVGRGHDQLHAVLDRPVAVEQQDILGAGADIDRQNSAMALPLHRWLTSCSCYHTMGRGTIASPVASSNRKTQTAYNGHKGKS